MINSINLSIEILLEIRYLDLEIVAPFTNGEDYAKVLASINNNGLILCRLQNQQKKR